jgi:hypothetical protein
MAQKRFVRNAIEDLELAFKDLATREGKIEGGLKQDFEEIAKIFKQHASVLNAHQQVLAEHQALIKSLNTFIENGLRMALGQRLKWLLFGVLPIPPQVVAEPTAPLGPIGQEAAAKAGGQGVSIPPPPEQRPIEFP